MRRAWLLVVLGLASWASFEGRAHAYSRCNHARLTRESVQLVDRCRACGHLTGPSPAPFAEVLVRYDKQQDVLLRKLALWHFPARSASAPLQGLARWLLPFAYSADFEVWTNALWARVKRGLSPSELYPALGAALHYVQDVAVPAHALPIFHPTFASTTDDFDDYEGFRGYAGDELSCAQLESSCAEVSVPRTLGQLLSRVRAQTRSDLSRPLTMLRSDGASSHTWGEFWTAGEPGTGFGEYGCRSYGASSVRCGDQLFQVDQEEYQIFATVRARAAIRAGANAIVSFQDHLVSCPKPSCEPARDDARYLPNRDTLQALAPRTEVD